MTAAVSIQKRTSSGLSNLSRAGLPVMLVAVLGPLFFVCGMLDSVVERLHRVPASAHCSQPLGLQVMFGIMGVLAVSPLAIMPVLMNTVIAAADVDS